MGLVNTNIQSDKLDLINWITSIENPEIIEQLKFVKHDNFEIPEWQKNIVRERIKKNKHNPDNYITLEELDKRIKL